MAFIKCYMILDGVNWASELRALSDYATRVELAWQAIFKEYNISVARRIDPRDGHGGIMHADDESNFNPHIDVILEPRETLTQVQLELLPRLLCDTHVNAIASTRLPNSRKPIKVGITTQTQFVEVIFDEHGKELSELRKAGILPAQKR